MSNPFVEKICEAIYDRSDPISFSTLDSRILNLLKANPQNPKNLKIYYIQSSLGVSIIECCLKFDLKKCTKFLLELDININSIYRYGESSLCFCIKNLSFKCAKLLISYEAKVNQKQMWGLTSLHYAASYGKIKFLKYLILRGGDVYIQNSAGRTVIDFINDDADKKEILEYIDELTLIKPNIKIKLKVL